MRVLPFLLRLLSFLLLALSLPTTRARADEGAARAHFEAGVRAYDEQRLADAAAEFERAYQLSPAWQVLYNLGSVYAALGDPVASVASYERYLQQADDSVSAERRAEVQAELTRQRSKIGFIHVSVDPPGAEVRVDARVVGHAPLSKPVAVSLGSHVVEISLEGYQGRRSEVLVGPGEPTVLAWPLSKHPATSSNTAATPRMRERGTVQRALGWSVATAGVGGLIAGSVMVAKGQLDHQKAVDLVNEDESMRMRAEQLEADADHRRTVGFAVLGVGAAVLLSGVITVWAAPRGLVPVEVTLAPLHSRDVRGASLLARF